MHRGSCSITSFSAKSHCRRLGLCRNPQKHHIGPGVLDPLHERHEIEVLYRERTESRTLPPPSVKPLTKAPSESCPAMKSVTSVSAVFSPGSAAHTAAFRAL